MSPNLRAFLDTIAWSEGTTRVVGSDNGYNVLVGGSLFHGYHDHPRMLVDLPKLGIKSTAAGRYQLLARYFDAYKPRLGLQDFGHEAQDLIAVQMISECGALKDIEAGAISSAISKCASRWASLPGAAYGQHENAMSSLLAQYKDSFETRGTA